MTIKQLFGRMLVFAAVSLVCGTVWAQDRYYRHIVQSGETLYTLATRYGVSTTQIKESNKDLSGDTIKQGTALLIPVVNHTDGIAGTNIRTMHKAARKETLWGIARQYGLSVEALLRANPELESGETKLKKGIFVCIPYATADSIVVVNPVRGYGKLHVAVVLPLLSNSVEGRRSVEFYRGFLMAVKDYKKGGTDVTVTALSEPAGGASMATVTEKLKTAVPQLIVGPLYPSHFQAVADLVRLHPDTKWLQPFSSRIEPTDRIPQLFMLNAPEEDKARQVGELLSRTFRGAKVVILRERADVANERSFVNHLRNSLLANLMDVSEVAAGYTIDDLRHALATGEQRTIFVAETSLTKGAAAVTARLRQLRQVVDVARFSVVGYPEWTTTSTDGLQRRDLCDADTYVFTPSYFNPYAQATRDFRTEYTTWFGDDIENTYPRMAPLGYDAGLYMFTGLHAYGPAFAEQKVNAPHVQTSISFTKPMKGNGLVSGNMYFVHYGINQVVNLIPLK